MLEDKPTPKQINALVKLAVIHRILEPIEELVRDRREARNLIYQLREK